MTKEKSLKEKLTDIMRQMRKYAEDCENDTCKDCHFSYFCGNGYSPNKIADTLAEVVELIGITVDALISKFIDKDIKAVEEGRGTMTDKQALEILKKWLEFDREMIGDAPKSDYDKFVSEENKALEIAIEALEKRVELKENITAI